jgi:hypothetical protein
LAIAASAILSAARSSSWSWNQSLIRLSSGALLPTSTAM